MEGNLDMAGESLESSVAKKDLLDIIGGMSDFTLEKILGLGETVPVFSFLVKGWKAGIAIRDAFFLEKVTEFLREVGRVPDGDRSRMIERIQDDAGFRYKFGKFSVIAIDRFNDGHKAKFLGIAAQYLAREEINFEFYQRFSNILDNLTVADLQEFTGRTFLNFGRNTYYGFESLGLLTTILKLPSESDLRISFKMDPKVVRVSHRRLTDWGLAAKNILLERPIGAPDS